MSLTRNEALKALAHTRSTWPRNLFQACQYAPDGCPSFDDEWYWHELQDGEIILNSEVGFDNITREEWIKARGVPRVELDPNHVMECELPPDEQWPEYAKIAVMHEDGTWIFGTFEDAEPTDDPKGWKGIGAGWWYPGPKIVSKPAEGTEWKESIAYRHTEEQDEHVHDSDEGQVINDTPLGGMAAEESPWQPKMLDRTHLPSLKEVDEMFEAARNCNTPRDPGQHYRKELRIIPDDRDIEEGFVTVTLDPYRICALYEVGGGPREQLVKKGLRGESKGQTEQEVIDDLRAILDRWEEMVDENQRMEF